VSGQAPGWLLGPRPVVQCDHSATMADMVMRKPRKEMRFDERLVSLESTEAGSDLPGLDCISNADSSNRFAQADETLIFFDWDDTLFPTTEFIDRWHLKIESGNPEKIVPSLERLKEEQLNWLQIWQESLQQLLTSVCSLGRCVIVTNSKGPWVHDCIEQLAPNLLDLFSGPAGPKVIYAREVLQAGRSSGRLRPPISCNPVKNTVNDEKDVTLRMEMSSAKFEAMHQEAKAFYGRDRHWKNIISVGDMEYEHEAVQELGFRRTCDGEQLRIKSLLFPAEPYISALVLRIDFLRLTLPSFVALDCDASVDMHQCEDPLLEMANALDMPELYSTGFPCHAWGHGAPPDMRQLQEARVELAAAVQGCWH